MPFMQPVVVLSVSPALEVTLKISVIFLHFNPSCSSTWQLLVHSSVHLHCYLFHTVFITESGWRWGEWWPIARLAGSWFINQSQNFSQTKKPKSDTKHTRSLGFLQNLSMANPSLIECKAHIPDFSRGGSCTPRCGVLLFWIFLHQFSKYTIQISVLLTIILL